MRNLVIVVNTVGYFITIKVWIQILVFVLSRLDQLERFINYFDIYLLCTININGTTTIIIIIIIIIIIVITIPIINNITLTIAIMIINNVDDSILSFTFIFLRQYIQLVFCLFELLF